MLLNVELKLWRAILAVATGAKTVVTAIEHFLEAVPWDALEDVSDADRKFFLPGIDSLVNLYISR